MSSNSEVEDGEIDMDKNVKDVVKMLMVETKLLSQNVTSKINCLERFKEEMEQMQESERSLRTKLSDESEQIRKENVFLHKALSLLEEQAYILCEENRQHQIKFEKQRDQEAELSLLKSELESELKKYREIDKFSDAKSANVDQISLDSLKNLKENSKKLLEHFNGLLTILQLQQKAESCLQNDLEQAKQTVESIKMENENLKVEKESNLMQIDCLQTQINAQEAELEKIGNNLTICKKQMATNLELERKEMRRLNKIIADLRNELQTKEIQNMDSTQFENVEKLDEIQSLKDKILSLTNTNATYRKKIKRLNNLQKLKQHYNVSKSFNGRKIKKHSELRHKIKMNSDIRQKLMKIKNIAKQKLHPNIHLNESLEEQCISVADKILK